MAAWWTCWHWWTGMSIVLETGVAMGERPAEARKPFGGKRYTGSKKGRKHASRVLKDMRHVYETTDGAADTAAQAKLRRLWDANPDKFVERLAGLEKVHRAEQAKVEAAEAKAGTGPADEGARAARELIDSLLAEWEVVK